MSKQAYGPATWHILGSQGPQVSPLHFYSTTYSVTHGREGSVPTGGFRHKGTGYASNFRPAIYYSSKLDDIDNPTIGNLLKDNYDSHTKKEYIRYRMPSGSDPFPSKVQPFTSGFAHNMPRTVPTSRQVRSVHVDTAREFASVPVFPRKNTTLSSHQPKDPVASENAGHGPKSMSTEYHTRFLKQDFRDEALHSSRHSNKEESGFTHACNIEPVTFRPQENHAGDIPGHMTWRPTGSSIMKNCFREPVYMKGGEPFQTVAAKADRSNGYVKGSKAIADVQPQASEMVGYTRASQVHSNVLQRVKKEDPAEYTILMHPEQHSSLTQRSFRGSQRSPPSEAQRLARESVGSKEMTGFSENNCPMVEPRNKDVQRFSTHYQYKFNNPNPSGAAREGHVATGSGVQPPANNSFCKGTQVHCFGPSLNTARAMREMDPYVARSVIKSDPYFDDHTYDSKRH